ncbi:MAG: gliding motility-associated C-terminal domain-containing protein, partial [Hymenobacteraceae bacterium]|nr:gliding motility-associated C-terminal domain-containing protein [Hymenobacteraceae bacterium]
MKKLIRLSCWMIAAILSSFFSQEAYASHAQGSDLTYVGVAPNIYVVQYKFYRDCSGIAASSTESLTYRAPGCSSGGNQTMQKNSQTIGNPYCDQIVPVCNNSSALPPNYEEHIYSTTLTVPTACSNWILSVRISARNNSRNLSNGSSQYLYSEALLNNAAAPGNTSPQFQNVPVPYVCVNQPATFSLNAIDIDGDSLQYVLVPALADFNSPVPYATGFTGTAPFGPNASPGINLDPVNGAISFTPTVFNPGATSASGENKYVVVVQVNEFRETTPGTWTKVGHVRRDILVTVIDCPGNVVPDVPRYVVNDSLDFPADTVTTIQACNTAIVKFRAQDLDPGQKVFITTNAPTSLPVPVGGRPATFTLSGSSNSPTGTVTWTPDASLAGRTYYFDVTVTDDACPIPGRRVVTLGIKVEKNDFAIAATADSIICAGQPTTLNVTSLRPLIIEGRPAQIRYEWTPAATLDDSTKQNPIATPLVTTTYTVKVFSDAGPTCFDVAEVTVVVDDIQPMVDTVTVSNDSICFGETVRLAGVVSNDTSAKGPFTYMWTTVAGDTLPDMQAAIDVMPQPGVTDYVFHAISVRGCETLDTVRVVTGDSITADFKMVYEPQAAPLEVMFENLSNSQQLIDSTSWSYVAVDANDQPLANSTETLFSNDFSPLFTLQTPGRYRITLRSYDRVRGRMECMKEAVQFIDVPQYDIPNVFTPNNDGKNDVFVIQGVRPGSEVKIFNRWGALVKEINNYD